MPRPPRVHLTGVLYHVSARALEDKLLFRDAADYRTYLDLLKEYQQQFGFKLFAFVLLADQLCLCIELTGEATISEIMHALNSRYIKSYNRRYGYTGHLFQERFKSTILEKAPSLLRLTGYLHSLPARRGLVKELSSYPWSSYHRYLATGTSTDELHQDREVQEVFKLLDQAHPGMTYASYVQALTEEDVAQVARDLECHVAGSEAFMAFVQEQYRKTSRSTEEPKPQTPEPVMASTLTNGHTFTTQPGPLLQPRPAGPRQQEPSWLVTGSLMVTFVSLCTAALYDRNLVTLKSTVRVLAQERTAQSPIASETASEPAGAALADFTVPVHLGGTSWALDIRPMDGSRDASHRDRVTFQGGRFSSTAQAAQGFLPARYAVTRQESGSVTWEAAQTDKQGTIVSWQGASDGRIIHGMMIRQEPGRPAVRSNFVGTILSPEHDDAQTMRKI